MEQLSKISLDLNEDQSNITHKKNEEIYDCCICRQPSVSTGERPIVAVTLLQSTSGIIKIYLLSYVRFSLFNFQKFD